MNKELSENEITATISILNKFQSCYQSLNVPIFSFRDLFKLLSKNEQNFILNICNMNLINIDVELPLPTQLMIPSNDTYTKNFVRIHLDIAQALCNLNVALKLDINKQIYILSGYRSPAYQLLIFLRELYKVDFSFLKASRVAKMPFESEHSFYPYHAIDIGIEKSSDKISTRFEKTRAYKWMITRAGEFGFSLSYPAGNLKNTIFEPWHWLYVNKH